MSVAVLHDILEDGPWTVEELADRGINPTVCEAVEILTRQAGEPYMDHVRRVCGTPGVVGDTARAVMVADLTVSVARADSDALRERYQQSLLAVSSFSPVAAI